ncbi:MAG: hypothetical protein Q9227_003112 [Pyrenula ochraceoflavens]
MAQIYNSQLDAFDLYHRFREAERTQNSSDDSKLPALGHALAGATGAAISNVVTYPLDLIITRLQIQRRQRGGGESGPDDTEYKDVWDAVQKIYYTEGGVTGFYTGLLQDTGKTVADSFLFFLAYNDLRRRRLNTRYGSPISQKLLPPQDELGIGFVAGAFTKLLTTPIATVVTRKQTDAMISSHQQDIKSSTSPPQRPSSPTTQSIIDSIYTQKGLQGFWSGYSASLILTLNPSITFFLFELLKRLLLPRSSRSHPSPTSTFLLAAISKAIASSITYPFSLAKAHAQAAPSTTNDSSSSSTSSSGILSTLTHLVHALGPTALYSGLPLELLKSFFSHGTTMLVKQHAHSLIISLYYSLSTLSGLLTRRPGVAELMQRADAQRVEYFDLARERAREAKAVLGEGVGAVAGGGVGGGMGRANETAELVADYVEEEVGEWRSLYRRGLWGDKG